MNPYQRIVVIGTSCSGKTTLARQLATTLRAPHIELDALHWLPNWQERPDEEFWALTQQAIAAPGWTLDGNYSVVRPLVWGRATAVIWLNYSFPLVMGRALKRTIRRVFSREELFAGNRESFRQAFLSRDSILWWVITTYRRRRRDYPILFEQPEYTHLQVLEFTSPGQTARFVADLAHRQSGAAPGSVETAATPVEYQSD
jgi:adenylate kinase family enzyme